jgi:hypothetical protein
MNGSSSRLARRVGSRGGHWRVGQDSLALTSVSADSRTGERRPESWAALLCVSISTCWSGLGRDTPGTDGRHAWIFFLWTIRRGQDACKAPAPDQRELKMQTLWTEKVDHAMLQVSCFWGKCKCCVARSRVLIRECMQALRCSWWMDDRLCQVPTLHRPASNSLSPALSFSRYGRV